MSFVLKFETITTTSRGHTTNKNGKKHYKIFCEKSSSSVQLLSGIVTLAELTGLSSKNKNKGDKQTKM